jgi:hypothetical protein
MPTGLEQNLLFFFVFMPPARDPINNSSLVERLMVELREEIRALDGAIFF